MHRSSRRSVRTRKRARCRGFLTELIEQSGRGDQQSLGRLVELLQPLVLAAARRRFPDRAPDDVAVEVFVRVWQLAPTYDRRREGPVTWILRQVADLALADVENDPAHLPTEAILGEPLRVGANHAGVVGAVVEAT